MRKDKLERNEKNFVGGPTKDNQSHQSVSSMSKVEDGIDTESNTSKGLRQRLVKPLSPVFLSG